MELNWEFECHLKACSWRYRMLQILMFAGCKVFVQHHQRWLQLWVRGQLDWLHAWSPAGCCIQAAAGNCWEPQEGSCYSSQALKCIKRHKSCSWPAVATMSLERGAASVIEVVNCTLLLVIWPMYMWMFTSISVLISGTNDPVAFLVWKCIFLLSRYWLTIVATQLIAHNMSSMPYGITPCTIFTLAYIHGLWITIKLVLVSVDISILASPTIELKLLSTLPLNISFVHSFIHIFIHSCAIDLYPDHTLREHNK